MITASASGDLGAMVLDLHRRHLNEMLERVAVGIDAGGWSNMRAAFAALRQEFDEHVRLEEELLASSVDGRNRSRGGPSANMRIEHEEMRRLLEAVDGLL